jgi:hypothetical protein
MSICGGKGPELSLSVSVEVGAHVRVVVHGLLYACRVRCDGWWLGWQ